MSVETGARALDDRIASQYMWSWRRRVIGPEKQFWTPARRSSNQKSHPPGVKRKACGPLATGAKRRQCYKQDAGAQSSLASGASAGPPVMAEIIWDSTNFACKDIQVNVNGEQQRLVRI